MADYSFLCARLCNNVDGIAGAWTFKEADLVASCSRSGFPAPNRIEQKKMFVQAHLMIEMAQTNQQMYGAVKYVSVSFANADCYLFPMNDDIVLGIACVSPYSMDVIKRAISELVV